MARLEAVRVAQDAAYAASLSDADWYALSQDPDWQQLVAEQSETLPAVRQRPHPGNLPDAYKDVFLGAAHPPRFRFSEAVFEVGAPIAVIAADSEHIADEAMRQIDVQYEVLPAALDMLEAMKP